MAALIRQANSGYELANKPKIKAKDLWWKRRERKQNNDNNKQTLSEKKEEAGNVSEQRDKGLHDNPCTRYNPLSSDNNTAGQQTLMRLPPSLVHNNNNVNFYHALINALSAHMIHINLNMIFYTHVKHSPTKTIYIKYYLK